MSSLATGIILMALAVGCGAILIYYIRVVVRDDPKDFIHWVNIPLFAVAIIFEVVRGSQYLNE